MHLDKKDQICDALEDAISEVRGQSLEEHHRMVASVGAVGAVPSWLMTILQLLGPPVLQAVQTWLNNQFPPKAD